MLYIKHIPLLSPENLPEASEILEEIKAQPVICNNWPEQFPYTPQVVFRIAHNDRALFIRFDVTESCILAKVDTDNGKVCTDSCVELFISLDDAGYYNFEANCIGKVLAGFRKERPQVSRADEATLNSIRRWSSLGSETFEERTDSYHWQLLLAIPATAFFKHHLEHFGGLRAKANIYKCGDHLSKVHYLSWQPIDFPRPNFHLPSFFTDIEFNR